MLCFPEKKNHKQTTKSKASPSTSQGCHHLLESFTVSVYLVKFKGLFFIDIKYQTKTFSVIQNQVTNSVCQLKRNTTLLRNRFVYNYVW